MPLMNKLARFARSRQGRKLTTSPDLRPQPEGAAADRAGPARLMKQRTATLSATSASTSTTRGSNCVPHSGAARRRPRRASSRPCRRARCASRRTRRRRTRSAPRAGSPRRRSHRGSRGRPSARARRGRPARPGRMLSLAPRMRSPATVCWRMIAHSASSSGPGLLRITSGTATLPTSWSSAARISTSSDSASRPIRRPTAAASVGDPAVVDVEVGLALGHHADEQVTRLRAAGAAAAALAGVHALVGEPQRLGRVLGVLGQDDEPVGSRDGEPVAARAERVDGALDERDRRRRARRRRAGRTRRRRGGRRVRRPCASAGARRPSSASPAGWPKASL